MSEACNVCASRNDMSQLGNACANGTKQYFPEKQKSDLVKEKPTAFDLEACSVLIFPSGEYLKQILDRKAKRKVQAGKNYRQVL